MKVVLLPGMDGTGQLLEPLAEQLRLRTHLPEIRRYPHDRAQSYAELIEQEVIPSLPTDEPFVLLGESFSGPIALALAQRGLPGLRGLVLVVTFAEPPDNILLSLTKVLPMNWLLSAPIPCWVAHKVMLGGRPVRGDQDALCRVMKLVQPKVLARRLEEIRELRLTRKPIELPALYIRATEDLLLPAGVIDGVKSLIAELEVADIEGPHLVLDTAPERCASLIDLFVRRLPPLSAGEAERSATASA